MTRMLTFLAFLVIAFILGAAAADLASRGHPVTLPLDDAYIPLQYARSVLAGDPGSYFPGEPLSTGATSPLWMLLLAGAAALVPGAEQALPSVALALCTLAMALALTLAYRLARRHGAGVTGALAAPVALLLTPCWLFGSLNGMETGLCGAALLGGAFALAGGSPAWLLPLAFVRPEGAVIALGILAARTLRLRARGPAARRAHDPATSEDAVAKRRSRRAHDPATSEDAVAERRPRRANATALSLLVAAVALVTLVWPWILTAGPPSAWTSKALWTEPRADVRGFYIPRLPYFAGRVLWFGLSGGRTQPPLDVVSEFLRRDAWGSWLWTLFTLGGALAALLGRRARGPLALWAVASLAALAGVAWDAHHYRYLVPAYPLLIVAAVAGWFGSSWRPEADRVRAGLRTGALRRRLVPRGTRPVHLMRSLCGGIVLVGLVAAAAAAPNGVRAVSRRFYRNNCERVANMQVATGNWIRERLPAGTRVATHDVGAIAFSGQRPITDLVGLVSPSIGNAYRHGEGALWEALDALPPSRRPTHAAIVPAWMPYLSRTLWIGERLWSTGGGGRTRTRDPKSRDMEIRQLSWPNLDDAVWPGGDFGNLPALHGHAGGEMGWTIVDGVDVADLVSERAHRFRGAGPVAATIVRDLGFDSRLMPAARAHAMEGGRTVEEETRFTLRLHPAEPFVQAGAPGTRPVWTEALLVLRSSSPRECDLSVRVNGWSGTMRVPRGETVFHEPVLRIPREVLAAADDGELEIVVEGSGYAAFHWWLLAGR